jgi:hypothetical protein
MVDAALTLRMCDVTHSRSSFMVTADPNNSKAAFAAAITHVDMSTVLDGVAVTIDELRRNYARGPSRDSTSI